MDSNELLNNVSMAAQASHLRELAQDRIVGAFRLQIEGKGPGPAEDDLQSFARLVLVEETLRKSCLVGMPNPAALAANTDAQAAARVSGT